MLIDITQDPVMVCPDVAPGYVLLRSIEALGVTGTLHLSSDAKFNTRLSGDEGTLTKQAYVPVRPTFQLKRQGYTLKETQVLRTAASLALKGGILPDPHEIASGYFKRFHGPLAVRRIYLQWELRDSHGREMPSVLTLGTMDDVGILTPLLTTVLVARSGKVAPDDFPLSKIETAQKEESLVAVYDTLGDL